MRKYYEGKPESMMGLYDVDHYKELAKEWYLFSRAELIAQEFQQARESQVYAAQFAAMARYKMGLQD